MGAVRHHVSYGCLVTVETHRLLESDQVYGTVRGFTSEGACWTCAGVACRGATMTSSDPSLASVAVVHDYLNQRGGAERCVHAMAATWPQAPIYPSPFRPGSTFPTFSDCDLRSSQLNRLPIHAGFRNLFPLYPAAFQSFGRLRQDVMISSSSGWAHGVQTGENSLHAVYCSRPPAGYMGASTSARRASSGR